VGGGGGGRNSRSHQFNHRGNNGMLDRYVFEEARMVEFDTSGINKIDLVWHYVWVCVRVCEC